MAAAALAQTTLAVRKSDANPPRVFTAGPRAAMLSAHPRRTHPLHVSPEPAHYVAIAVAAEYRLPPALRVTNMLGFSFFGLLLRPRPRG